VTSVIESDYYPTLALGTNNPKLRRYVFTALQSNTLEMRALSPLSPSQPSMMLRRERLKRVSLSADAYQMPGPSANWRCERVRVRVRGASNASSLQSQHSKQRIATMGSDGEIRRLRAKDGKVRGGDSKTAGQQIGGHHTKPSHMSTVEILSHVTKLIHSNPPHTHP
jgi:hypothetical protein